MGELDAVSMSVLNAVCMNSRATIKEIAKAAGCTRQTAALKLERLEADLGLRFVPEFDPQALGLENRNLIAVKLKKMPSKEKLRKLFCEPRVVQFAALCEGDFNLLIFTTARNQMEYLRWEFLARASLKDVLVSWKASNAILSRIGLFPLRKAVLEELEIPAQQKRMLEALSEDARIPLDRLGKSLGMTPMAARYNFDMILKKGYVKRFTAVIQKAPNQCELPFFMNFEYSLEYAEQAKGARDLMEQDEPGITGNSYALCVETNGNADAFLWVSAKDVGACYAKMREMEGTFKGAARVESAWLSEILCGLSPVRHVCVSEIYNNSEWLPKKGARDG